MAASIDTLLALDERPTAVLVLNEVLLQNAGSVFRERGLNIPGDISLTGSSTMEFDSFFNSRRVDQRIIACRAAELVLEMISNPPETPPRVLIPTSVHAGESIRSV